MLISEIYCSRQGEGFLTGIPSVFVRTSGCNLRCDFCDTPYASWNPEGDQMSISEVLKQVENQASGAEHVVLTGGEPMLPRDVEVLCERIRAKDFHITIETAGTIFRDLACDLVSISPKFSNSDPDEGRAGEWTRKHRSSRHRPDVVRRLIAQYPYQLKFVVASPSDLDEILEYLDEIQPVDSERVLLMPEGTEIVDLQRREKWLAPLSEKLGFKYCPRRHIEWYGNQRGT